MRVSHQASQPASQPAALRDHRRSFFALLPARASSVPRRLVSVIFDFGGRHASLPASLLPACLPAPRPAPLLGAPTRAHSLALRQEGPARPLNSALLPSIVLARSPRRQAQDGNARWGHTHANAKAHAHAHGAQNAHLHRHTQARKRKRNMKMRKRRGEEEARSGEEERGGHLRSTANCLVPHPPAPAPRIGEREKAARARCAPSLTRSLPPA